MEAVGRGDRVQFICDWEDSAVAGIAYSGGWIAHDESDQFLGWLWCRLLLLLLRLVIAFTAACFKLISSNQSWNIPSLHMHTYQLVVVLCSVHSVSFIKFVTWILNVITTGLNPSSSTKLVAKCPLLKTVEWIGFLISGNLYLWELG